MNINMLKDPIIPLLMAILLVIGAIVLIPYMIIKDKSNNFQDTSGIEVLQKTVEGHRYIIFRDWTRNSISVVPAPTSQKE